MPIAVTAARALAAAQAIQACWKAAWAAVRVSGVPIRATTTLTPKTLPIWRAMDTTALPVAARSAGRSAVAADRMVGRASPTPVPPSRWEGNSSVAYEGCRPMR